jgi:hypothetical protein
MMSVPAASVVLRPVVIPARHLYLLIRCHPPGCHLFLRGWRVCVSRSEGVGCTLLQVYAPSNAGF